MEAIEVPQQFGPLLRSLDNATFRANPEYEFVKLEQLPAEQQEALGALREDADFAGLLRSRSAEGKTAKAVCSNTAWLFETLKEPGPLPSRVFAELGSDSERTISRLVLDGILQIAEGTEWACGPDAYHADQISPSIEPKGILADLSLRALQHAAALMSADAGELSSRLYQYNTLPLTPAWLRRIPHGSALEEYLQIQVGGRNRRDLDLGWTRVSPETGTSPWIAWSSRAISAHPGCVVGYKLYLSPLPSLVRDVFRVWLSTITEAKAHHFKVGADARGLLRPDKMVAYFSDWSSVVTAASRISKELSGCAAQGVPFTSELYGGALCSWGSDPPSEKGLPAWLQRQSWRQWISYRLGSALAIAKGSKSAVVTAWRFAFERIRLDGVDPTTWTPLPAFWQLNSSGEVKK
jgi:hypothetical protein